MRLLVAATLILSLVACSTSHLGACTKDADCPLDTSCDPARSVCVINRGACVPRCDTAHACDGPTNSCQPVTTASIAITSPAAGAFATSTLRVVATARAPGGVTSVTFKLLSGATVVATASGAASPTDPASFSAAIPLTSVADGGLDLSATLTYAGGNASAKVSITVDQTPPTIALQTDGRTTLYAAGQTDTVSATIGDALSGVNGSTVALTVNGRSIPGIAGAAGAYTFPVVIDDNLLAAGTSATLPFTISASDLAGNTFTLLDDPRQVIRADRDAPAISSITYTPAGFTDSSGHVLIGSGPPGSVTVKAMITDGAGIAASTVCIRLSGETAACPHPGGTGGGNLYSFVMPRIGAVQDGTVPTTFTIEADDTLAAQLSGSSKAEHQQRLAQTVYFDTAGPAISVLGDATPYARTAAPIRISALIADVAGVPDGGVFLNGTVAPSFRDGGFFSFQLDPRGAPAGVEGAYAFAISATDNVNNSSDAGGTRIVDDAPPDASVRVFAGSADPGAAGVTYPAQVANTGWTGSSFIYSDSVHVKGTITDVSGIGAATLQVDGIELDGGVTAGVSRSLGCTAGAIACNFDVQVALNDPQNGAFHTGAAMNDAGVSAGEAIPSGFLQLTIAATDRAVAADGTPSAHAGSNATPARATRLLWQQAIASGNVTGLAVHPSGDVIVTSSSAANSVNALATDHPAVRWSYAVAQGIADQPAIGAGDANGAAIYVATNGGFIDALASDGGVLWQANTGAAFSVGLAVDSAGWTDGGTVEQAVVPDRVGAGPNLWAASSANSATPFSVVSDDVDTFSAPIVFNGFVWFGDGVNGASGNVTRHPMVGDGTFGASAVVSGLSARPYWGLVTDGTTVFAATVRPTQNSLLDMYSITPLFAMGWDTAAAHLAAEPTIGIDGNLFASDYTSNHALSQVATSSGAFSQVLSLGNGGAGNPPYGRVPLQGSDGHVYLPVVLSASNAKVLALVGSQVSWQLLLPSSTMPRAAAMDCSGRLFVGNGSTVYALVTDDHGLADTPWPNQRRDARNTGNASAPRYGMRTAPNACLQ